MMRIAARTAMIPNGTIMKTLPNRSALKNRLEYPRVKEERLTIHMVMYEAAMAPILAIVLQQPIAVLRMAVGKSSGE